MLRSREDDVILSLARFDPRPLKDWIVSLLTSPSLNWSYVLRESRSHGVAPLLYHNMRTLGLISLLPRTISEKFRKDYYRTSAINILLSTSLEEILAKMAKRKIPVIPLKGCLFMHTLYPVIALRPMIDLDLLVREEDYHSASAALKALGYRALYDPVRSRSALEYYAVQFGGRGKGVVEIHRALYQEFRHSLDIARLWARSRPQRLMGRPIRVLSLEDTIILLCLHLAQHDFRIRLISLVDIHVLISQAGETIRWDAVVSRAESQGVTIPVYLTLSLMHEWYGDRIPRRVLKRLRPCAPRRVLLLLLFDRRSLTFLRFDTPERITQLLLIPILVDKPWNSIRFAAVYVIRRFSDALTHWAFCTIVALHLWKT